MKLEDIKTTDSALVAAFLKFANRVHASENVYFWFDKGNEEGRYLKYIKKGAQRELTLDNNELVQKFNELAAQKKFKEMGPLFVKARGEVKGMLDGRMAEFSNSKEYKDYLAVKKAGNISKALKLLGVTGSNAKTMEALVKEYAVGTDSQKRAALEKMSKIAKAEQIKLALKNAGLL